MKVLIVESDSTLGMLWLTHMQRQGMSVTLAAGQTPAVKALNTGPFDVLVLDLLLDEGSALAVADLANYRYPKAQVIFVTNTRFFSDGSIFQLCTNARAFVQSDTSAEDLTAMVEHCARTA